METDSGPMKGFQDWEVLPSDSTEHPPSLNYFHEIPYVSIIQPEYFSVDARNQACVEDLDGNVSAHSDNISWVEPGSDENPIQFLNKESGEFWSDSSSDQSHDGKISVLMGNDETSILARETRELADEEMETTDDFGKLSSDSFGIAGDSATPDSFTENSDECIERKATLRHEVEAVAEEKLQDESTENMGDGVYEKEKKTSGEIEKRDVVWWKMPMEFLKFCVFRVSPVLTVSMAAALMGFVILSLRMYKMKKKAKGLQIKVTFDDKKVSQAMSRAARLNEAFSIVKRVPLVQPMLPAFGVTSWPAASLR